MLSSIGLSFALETSKASLLHGYQSTGLVACCNKYGLVSFANRFKTKPISLLFFNIKKND